MHITYKGDYALKAILCLVVNYGKVISIHDLAVHTDIPFKFLEQVLLELKRGGFVESRRGKIGGYLLAKKPSEIKLGEVIRFIDGPIEPIRCLEDGYSGCAEVGTCVFRPIWHKAAQSVSDVVDNVTFEDLVGRVQTAPQALSYSI